MLAYFSVTGYFLIQTERSSVYLRYFLTLAAGLTDSPHQYLTGVFTAPGRASYLCAKVVASEHQLPDVAKPMHYCILVGF